MSNAVARLPREQALPIAEELVHRLWPYCERLEIVGSLRRCRPTIGDIELLVVPKTVPETDLFGSELGTHRNLFDEHLDGWPAIWPRLRSNGTRAWGERYKAATYSGFAVDIFSCLPPAQYGVLKVIRTGSAEFSHRLVTPVEKGGWMPARMYCRDGQLWCDGEPISTPEERDVFAAIGRTWLPAEQREVH